MKKMILVVLMVLFLVGCDRHEVAYQQPVAVVQAQPVYVQNHDPMAGVLTGMVIGSMMSNGMRYDGHNGYEDNRYRGPSRTVVNHTTVNNVTVNKGVANTPAPSPAVASKSAPAAPTVAPKASFASRPVASTPTRSSFASRPSSSGSSSRSSFSSRRK